MAYGSGPLVALLMVALLMFASAGTASAHSCGKSER